VGTEARRLTHSRRRLRRRSLAPRPIPTSHQAALGSRHRWSRWPLGAHALSGAAQGTARSGRRQFPLGARGPL